MKITEDVRKFAAEQGIIEGSAIEGGLKQKATESSCGDAERWTGSPKRVRLRERPNQFTKSGSEIYVNG
jgi:hypothetical protein